MDNKMYIIIVGCGRLGSYLANKLSSQGHSIVVIDEKESNFEKLTNEFSGFKVEGDASQFSVLKQAKISKADMVMAVTNDDNLNLMVVQIAKKMFGVKKILARVYEPERQKIYQELGIDSVCPTLLSGELVMQKLELK